MKDLTYTNKSMAKYLLIALVTLVLVAVYVFMIVIGAVNVHACSTENRMALYLLLMGSSCLLKLLLFYFCPYNYTGSLLNKMHYHLVLGLVVNRYRTACFAARHNATDDDGHLETSFASSWPGPRMSQFFDSAKSKRKFICTFLFNFCSCCCCFCCFSMQQKKKKRNGELMSSTSIPARPNGVQFVRMSIRSKFATLKKQIKVFRHLEFTGEHKKVRVRHNKIHKRRRRLLSLDVLRYGLSYCLSKFLDIFIIGWFVAGNHWLFQMISSDKHLNQNQNFTTVDLASTKSWLHDCYRSSFLLTLIHIASSYALLLIACFLIVLLSILSLFAK